ncbi:uncharacterized protein LOC119678779 [Teleopsis dalmanni]|uniref:uncharacterized protein LOC119678779 n=1 Tax=Teleopsis dalmanni TaxID=139649 RepID=UPI0018CCA152|nr:uncharacterized protein LOC119678779 [Teleopsis dalmanni]XP_037946758.1 uncharacterized protein LOC119678779 [Teleopsis dalmanni]XP_037946759.1 uncharacterized protein LOC119678779 [Teleopsis dalmanni]
MEGNGQDFDFEIIEPSSKSDHLSGFNTENDEVWFMQLPKNLKPAHLLQQKLKLPGRSNLEHKIEGVAFEFSDSKDNVFGINKIKLKHSMRILPVRGCIVLRKRMDTIKEKEYEVNSVSKGSTNPLSIKRSHPLLSERPLTETNTDSKSFLTHMKPKRRKKADGN